MLPGSRPLKAGGICRTEASVVAVYAGNSGKTVVSEHALCESSEFSQHSSSAVASRTTRIPLRWLVSLNIRLSLSLILILAV